METFTNTSSSVLQIGNLTISEKHPVFFIAEIGQNHQGRLEIAKELIDAAKENGANCVKFQKTNLTEKFTLKVLEKPYDTENSWGKTYGEHKKYLEFSDDEFRELQQYAKLRDVLFTSSAMDVKSLEFLIKIDVPFIKIGSGDNNNVPLLIKAAQSGKPLIISTGMLTFEEIEKIVDILDKYSFKKNYALLHCVSSYPTPLRDINLSTITRLKNKFPGIAIGYSGHELGIEISVMATILGAKIIERHITLDQNQRGSDHKCSLLPEQFKEMVQKVREMQIAMGIPREIMFDSEIKCWEKLGKTLVASRKLNIGHRITPDDLSVKVAEYKGINAIDYENIVGRTLRHGIEKEEPLMIKHLEL